MGTRNSQSFPCRFAPGAGATELVQWLGAVVARESDDAVACTFDVPDEVGFARPRNDSLIGWLYRIWCVYCHVLGLTLIISVAMYYSYHGVCTFIEYSAKLNPIGLCLRLLRLWYRAGSYLAGHLMPLLERIRLQLAEDTRSP